MIVMELNSHENIYMHNQRVWLGFRSLVGTVCVPQVALGLTEKLFSTSLHRYILDFTEQYWV